MEEVAHLIVKVSSDQVATAEKRLEQLGYKATRAEGAVGGVTRASDGLMASIKGLLGPLAAFISITAGLTKLVNTSRQFESLNAQLKTATGTSENAATAFEAIQQFATTTPYDLAQATEAFIKLVNLGLTPSEQALRSYGNTASAMGKDLSQMVQAVANATTGEFEMLKQFGIKARTEADGISFIFRGTATKVRNDAKSIEDYFIKLGESNFANAMSERMKTLDGAISNLGDAWDVLFATIGNAGAGDLLKDIFRGATEAIQELTAMIASGQLAGYIDALFYKFAALSDGISNAFVNITNVVDEAYRYWGSEGADTADFIKRAFTELPENIRAAMQLVGATLGAVMLAHEASARAFVNMWIAAFKLTVDLAFATGKLMAVALNPIKAGTALKDFAKESGEAFGKFGTTAKEEGTKVAQSVLAIAQAWEESVVETLNERDASVATFKSMVNGADALRAAYDKLNAAKAAAGEGKDRLAGFGKGADDRLATERERRQFEGLKQSLQLEEISIRESYDKRLELIRNNTKEGSDLRVELEKELNARVTEEYEKAFQERGGRVLEMEAALREAIAAGRISEVESLTAALMREEEHIKASYDRRREAILENTELTEDERLNLLSTLERKYTQQQLDFEQARRKASLSLAADFFGNMSAIAGAFGKKGAKIAKAAAIAQTTIKTYESATSAYAALAGIPYVGPALGAAAAGAAIAAGLANVAAIKSQDYAGAYAHGGMIPSGKVGLVGEEGLPELVRGPAVVTSGRTVADMAKGGASPKITLNIINQAQGVEVVQGEERETADGRTIDMIVRRIDRDLAAKTRTGSSQTARAMADVFGLQRGAAA